MASSTADAAAHHAARAALNAAERVQANARAAELRRLARDNAAARETARIALLQANISMDMPDKPTEEQVSRGYNQNLVISLLRWYKAEQQGRGQQDFLTFAQMPHIATDCPYEDLPPAMQSFYNDITIATMEDKQACLDKGRAILHPRRLHVWGVWM
jgi:hypothetical protein